MTVIDGIVKILETIAYVPKSVTHRFLAQNQLTKRRLKEAEQLEKVKMEIKTIIESCLRDTIKNSLNENLQRILIEAVPIIALNSLKQQNEDIITIKETKVIEEQNNATINTI